MGEKNRKWWIWVISTFHAGWLMCVNISLSSWYYCSTVSTSWSFDHLVSLTLIGSQSDKLTDIVLGGYNVITLGDRWLWWCPFFTDTIYSGFHKRQVFHNVLLFFVLYYNNVLILMSVLKLVNVDNNGEPEKKTTTISVRSKQNQSYQSNISQKKSMQNQSKIIQIRNKIYWSQHTDKTILF